MTTIFFDKKTRAAWPDPVDSGEQSCSRHGTHVCHFLGRNTIHFALALTLLGVCTDAALARQRSLPWLESIGVTDPPAGIHTIRTEADVSVSDGLTYTVQSVFHDRQRAVFRRIYADRTITQGVDGRYVWTYDGQAEREAPAFVEEFVLGHQIHAQLLFFDQLHATLGSPLVAQFAGQKCMMMASENGASTWRFYYMQNGRPLGMELARQNAAPILFSFEDWRRVDSLSLPFSVGIDDGTRKFAYRYANIDLNVGSIAGFRAPDSVLSEEQKLIRLHRVFMDEHWFGQTAAMQAIRADSVLIVSDGDIHRLLGEQFDASMARIVASRKHSRYDDLVRPAVKISADGTLGWVVAQVSAQGVRLDATGSPSGGLEFVSAWIELYEKIDGRWRLVGNVSNFRPNRQ